MPLRSSLLPNATPWARASNNVKKTQSQMCEKTRFKIFCKTKQKHFWFQSHISILRLAFVQNEFQQTKKQKIKYVNHINDNCIKFEVSLHFGGDLAFCAPSDVFYD
jgi:hypothetical protein